MKIICFFAFVGVYPHGGENIGGGGKIIELQRHDSVQFCKGTKEHQQEHEGQCMCVIHNITMCVYVLSPTHISNLEAFMFRSTSERKPLLCTVVKANKEFSG